jgi:hypothetical protein
MRFLVGVAAVVGTVCATASAWPAAAMPTVSCESIVTPGGEFAWRPSRVVLDAVDVPPAYIRQTVPTGERRWRYWSKVGLVVRADSPVVRVSLPVAWRTRAAITWGGAGPASSLRLLTCPPSSSLGKWNPYAGGFLLRSRSACVPLVFRVGARTETVRFGVGRRCG